jgi:hypothetical protein
LRDGETKKYKCRTKDKRDKGIKASEPKRKINRDKRRRTQNKTMKDQDRETKDAIQDEEKPKRKRKK